MLKSTVGPDSSRLIAEVIASCIDHLLSKNVEIGPRGASRYIDDYTVTAADGTSGEGLIAALRQAASAFELELNNEKSGIFSTAARHDGGWNQEARAYVPRDSIDASQFLLFFYRIGPI